MVVSRGLLAVSIHGILSRSFKESRESLILQWSFRKRTKVSKMGKTSIFSRLFAMSEKVRAEDLKGYKVESKRSYDPRGKINAHSKRNLQNARKVA